MTLTFVQRIGALSLALVLMAPLAHAVTDEVIVTQTVTSGIAINSPADVSMSRALTVTDHTAIGTSTWNVITNNNSGYTMTMHSTVVADCAGKTLCNATSDVGFTDLGTTTPATWSSPSNNYVFGFSAFGTRVNTGTYGTGSSCGASHAPSGSLKYRGFEGATSTLSVVNHTNTSAFAGDDTTVCFAVEQNGAFAPSGSYTATVVATAVTQ